jgi:hypothetical protein
VLTLSNYQNGLKRVIKRSKTLMKWSGTFRKGHGTFRNGHGTFRNGQKRSETVRNGQKRSCKRSGTPRNVRVGTQQRFGTNSGKRSRYVHVHVHVSKTKETVQLKLLNNRINIVEGIEMNEK